MKDEKNETWSIPEPFLLNCWKHHLNFIRFHLSGLMQDKGAGNDKIKSILLQLGRSQMDLYTGNFSPREIAVHVKERLTNINCFEKTSFKTWINSPPEGYKMLPVPDTSVWTLRMGQENRYIHLHPSRYSNNTIRIKANTLKTLIALKWMMHAKNHPLNLEILNTARKEFFGAPPVKSLSVINNIRHYLPLLNIE